MAVTALLIWAVVRSSTGEKVTDYTFTQFMTAVSKDEIRDVTITGSDVTGTFKKDNTHFRTTIPELSRSLQGPSREECQYHDQGQLRRVLDDLARQWVAHDTHFGVVDFHHAADAVGGEQSVVLRQEPGPPALQPAKESYL